MSTSITKAGVKSWFTAMPLYQGRLCDILPLEIPAIEEVMLQLFDSVNYMHGQRVLHKDIKPENILVKGKSRPDVVLADYGICASLNNRTELMRPSGTRGFAAPEIARMIVQTPAVDIFALGATLFIALEPERCNGQSATVATLENVARCPPKIYSGLVQSMMAHDPKKRPSLKECIAIVKARKRDWKKPTPLALLPSTVPSAFDRLCSKRIPKATAQEPPILDLAKFSARTPRLAPIARNRQQQIPTRLNFKGWEQAERIQGPKALNRPKSPTRNPQPPTPMQQVDFSVPPPPLAANLFAHADRDSASNMPPPARRPAAPTRHEPPRTPIRRPDNEIKRRIRRGGERRQMIERWHRIRVEKDKVCHGAEELASGTPLSIARGLRDMTKAGLDFTGQYLGLIFADMPAAHRILPQASKWGLNTNRRLIYGLKSQGLWPMTPAEYEAERLQSELDFPNTTEGRRVQARLDAEAEHRRWERLREPVAGRGVERLQQPRVGRLLEPAPRRR